MKHAGNKTGKQEIHPGFKTQVDVTRSPKQGCQWPQKRIYVYQIFLKNLIYEDQKVFWNVWNDHLTSQTALP